VILVGILTKVLYPSIIDVAWSKLFMSGLAGVSVVWAAFVTLYLKSKYSPVVSR